LPGAGIAHRAGLAVDQPALHAGRAAAAGTRNALGIFKLFRNPVVSLGMLAVGLFFMGQFTLFTYVRPFLETVTRVEVGTLSLILLVIGVMGFVGTMLISIVLKRGFYQTLAVYSRPDGSDRCGPDCLWQPRP
jgi:predicted MFS family arabinose efflux permease